MNMHNRRAGFMSCEGFLGTFLDENPRLLDGLELVVYEADAPDVCDYAGIRRLLRAHAFECVVAGVQNVWRRTGRGCMKTMAQL